MAWKWAFCLGAVFLLLAANCLSRHSFVLQTASSRCLDKGSALNAPLLMFHLKQKGTQPFSCLIVECNDQL